MTEKYDPEVTTSLTDITLKNLPESKIKEIMEEFTAAVDLQHRLSGEYHKYFLSPHSVAHIHVQRDIPTENDVSYFSELNLQFSKELYSNNVRSYV